MSSSSRNIELQTPPRRFHSYCKTIKDFLWFDFYSLAIFFSHVLVLLQFGLVHIGHRINSWGLTRGPSFKCFVTISASPCTNNGWSFGATHLAIFSAQTFSPMSLAYSMSNSWSVSMCSLTNAIGTRSRFFWPRLTSTAKWKGFIILVLCYPTAADYVPFDRKFAVPYLV